MLFIIIAKVKTTFRGSGPNRVTRMSCSMNHQRSVTCYFMSLQQQFDLVSSLADCSGTLKL